MTQSSNKQPSSPTYFLVAGQEQLQLFNTTKVTPLKKSGVVPKNQPRFISASLGSRVKHMVACIGCDFIEKPAIPVHDMYRLSASKNGGLMFQKILQAEKGHTPMGQACYIKIMATGKIFAILNT